MQKKAKGILEGATEEDGNLKLARQIDEIGFTRSHKMVVFLLVWGVIIHVFALDSVGIMGPNLQNLWGISTVQLTFLGTVINFSIVIGGVLSGYFADKYGRKPFINLNVIMFAVGAAIAALSPNYSVMVVSMFVMGVGIGGENGLTITMVSEISPTRSRGPAVGFLNIAAGGLGNFLAPGLGFIIIGSGLLGFSDENWRWYFWVLFIPVFLIVFYRRFIPESPRFLFYKGKVKEANRSLSVYASGYLRHKHLKTTNYLQDEDVNKATAMNKKTKASDIFRGGLAKRTIAVSIAELMITGVQISILTLLPVIMVARGYDIGDSLMFTMAINFGGLLGAIGATLLARNIKRKLVLIPSGVLAFLSGIAFAMFAYNIPLILLIGIIFQMSILLIKTTLWIYPPEMYPTHIRAFGSTFITSIGSIAGSFMPLIAGLLFDLQGVNAVFFFSAACALIFIISISFAPETLGRTLEDINETREDKLLHKNK